MWFNKKDLTIKPIINIKDLHGYVLPHAGTAYTGKIISDTLRFRPCKKIKKIIILYYPSSKNPNITEYNMTYYHEYYVPWKCLDYILGNNTIIYEGYNITDIFTKKIDINIIKQSFNLDDTLIVVSSDFSHFLDFNEAIELENKAAHALMFRELQDSAYIKIVDDVKTYKVLYEIIPNRLNLQWIGRSRSPGEKGVGYLSFLLREKNLPNTLIPKLLPDGMFVTAFDENMNARECLGNWFSNNNNSNSKSKSKNVSSIWNINTEKELINKVINLARTTSRLTGGQYLNTPVSNYTVTYLYKEKDTSHNFIRGYHGILYNAFYLPEVFLENTFNNGRWIKDTDTTWISGYNFNLSETFSKLNIKAGVSRSTRNTKTLTKKRQTQTQNNNYTIYRSDVIHYKIINKS